MVFACCSLLITFCSLFFACNVLVVIFCMFLIILDITSACSLLLSLWSFLLKFCYNYAPYVLISFRLVLLLYVAAIPKKCRWQKKYFSLYWALLIKLSSFTQIFYFLFFQVAKHYHFLSEVNPLWLQWLIHTCKSINKKMQEQQEMQLQLDEVSR